jgi:phosphate:Na+ symporter
MNFENAAAMIIGTNIGTTLTANIVARQAINPAQRLALAHTLFNVAGAILFFSFFRFSVTGTAQITEFVYGTSPMYSISAIPIGLAVYHTGFNIITGLLFLALLKPITSALQLLIPVKQNESRKMSLKYMETGYLSMTEMLLIQVQDEIVNYGKQISDMFSLIPEYLSEKRDEKFQKIQKKIFKFEDKADNKEVVISNYLTRLAVNSLTEAASRKVSSMLKIVDDIESIADQCVQLEKTIRLKNEAKAWLNPEMREQILKMFTLVHEAIENMNINLAKNYTPGILIKATEIELKINNARDNFLSINKKNIENGEYSYQNGALFAEIANYCEKIGDHVINVNQAIATNIKS